MMNPFRLFSYRTTFFALIGCLLTSQLSAYDDSLDDLPTSFEQFGETTRTNGTSFTYNIPITNWPSGINFEGIKGGDGGKAKAAADVGSAQVGEGGGGAFIRCYFNISPTEADTLRPGGQLRLVLASKGESKSRKEDAGGGGGGGTGILYKAPTEGANWEPLVIAGGGGGGAASSFVTGSYSKDGQNANVTIEGDDSAGDGADNGGGGQGIIDQAGGGGGWERPATGDFHGGEEGQENDGLGDGGQPYDNGTFGGFGCGGGGAGYAFSDFDDTDSGGGGGGGYSGGGAGNNDNTAFSGGGDANGGGGGSFIDDRATNVTATARDGEDLDGFVSFKQDRPTNGTELDPPSITLTGSSSITVYDFESYTDAGASATDVYGNAITMSSPSSNVQQTPGTYSVTYTATDQFGKSATATRTVTVISANKPTFSLAGNVTVDENSGEFSQSGFASNFNANDSGQSLEEYVVINMNTDLFADAGQPAIDTSGTLSFTSADDEYGSATVTVTAIDNEDDPINGESDPVTFIITVSEISIAPSFTLSGDLSRAKDSGAQTVEGFATDFTPNDAGQSFDRYEVSNNNTAIFSVQPSIDSSGTLTFTPNASVDGSPSATVTVTGYDDGPFNTNTSKTFTLTISEIAPVASFSVDKTILIPGSSVSFTDASSNATGWAWDFDNDGQTDSTEQNPTHTYSDSGTYTVRLSVSNAVGIDSTTTSDLIRVVEYGIINGNFDSTDFANGFGTEENLGRGWYGQSGDDGSSTGLHWTAGLTAGTPGILTQVGSGGSATRFGQFFAINLEGSDWALSFDLGETATFLQVRMYAGVLADDPSGTVLRNDNAAPAGSLVEDGWTSILYHPETTHEGTVVLNLDDIDLSQFNVVAIQFKSSRPTGTTFDNFALVQQVSPTLNPDSFSGFNDETVSGNLLENDAASALNAPLSLSEVNGASENLGTTITLDSGALLTVASDGSFTYNPNGAFDDLLYTESATDEFTYTVDTDADPDTATVTISIYAPDPVATFRDEYGLAGNGYQDDQDWSGNGIKNIFYHVFGLGNPYEAAIDETKLPTLEIDGDSICYRFLRPIDLGSLPVECISSVDLAEWDDVSELTGDLAPTQISTEAYDATHEEVMYFFRILGGPRFWAVEAGEEDSGFVQ